MNRNILLRLNPFGRRRAKRLEEYLEIELHEWMDAIERHRKERDEKERLIDLALHHERRESSNSLENREMRMSDMVADYDRALVAAHIDIRKRLARECPELLSRSELSKLEDSMVHSVQASRAARRGDYERRARATGVPMLRPKEQDAAVYGDLEALVRREVRKLALDQSLGRMVEPSKTSVFKAGSEYEPAIRFLAAILTLLAAAIGLYLKFR